MVIQNKTPSQMSFELLNTNHPYRKLVYKYAEALKSLDDLSSRELGNLIESYIDYRGIDFIDIPVPKKMAIHILMDYSPAIEDYEWFLYEEIVEKFKSDISEDIEEETERLRTDQMCTDVEMGSVNSGEFT